VTNPALSSTGKASPITPSAPDRRFVDLSITEFALLIDDRRPIRGKAHPLAPKAGVAESDQPERGNSTPPHMPAGSRASTA
jgi:hypothetical protein